MAISYGGVAPRFLGVTWTMGLMCTILVAIRAKEASKIGGRWRQDFIWVVIALVFNMASQFLMVGQCLNGVGNNYDAVPEENLDKAVFLVFAGADTSLVALSAAKTSIAALMLQVTPKRLVKRRMLLYAMTGISWAVNIAEAFICATNCVPEPLRWARFWEGACPRTLLMMQFGYCTAAVSVMTDCFLALFPITIVWDLQMPKDIKIAFCVLMGTGFLPVASAIGRIVYLRQLILFTNPTVSLIYFTGWSAIEVWSVMLVSCVPPLRPFFVRMYHHAKNTGAGRLRSDNTKELPDTPEHGQQIWVHNEVEQFSEGGHSLSEFNLIPPSKAQVRSSVKPTQSRNDSKV